MKSLEQQVRRAAHRGLKAAGQWLAAQLRDLVSFDPGDDHIHSPPGTPPYHHKGNLKRSIECRMTDTPEGPVAWVGIFRGAEKWYLALHDRGGTYTGKKASVTFPPRPWISTYRKFIPEVIAIFRANFHP